MLKFIHFREACLNQVGFNKQILSYVYVCLLPSEVSLQLKNLPKNIYKNKCREDEIDIIFNSPCLRRIFQCGGVYLHFTYNDIYICYKTFNFLFFGFVLKSPIKVIFLSVEPKKF